MRATDVVPAGARPLNRPGVVMVLRLPVAAGGRAERQFTVELVNGAGELHASCEKVISIKKAGLGA